MRFLLTLLSLAVATALTAQVSLDLIGPALGAVKSLTVPEAGLRNNPILVVDFADGIPAGWESEDAGGIAHWEYRGPSTSPDNTVGTIGSCDTGGQDSAPPASPTVDNGFVIFDSAFWDDPVGPCGNLGTGDAPGPHYAPLTSPSIDLSDYENVLVRWSHLYKQWPGNSEVYLEANVDDAGWVQIWEIDFDVFSSTTESGAIVTVNLSDIAGGSSDVRLRWVFEGAYYWWMIDDIEVCEILPYDLSVGKISYEGIFDPIGEDGDLSGLKYVKWPDELAPVQLQPTARVHNDGANTQNGVSVDLTITQTQTNTQLYNETATISAISGLNSSFASFPNTELPAIWGPYALEVSTEGQEDSTPENNTAEAVAWMTDVEFVRDALAMDASYLPPASLFDDPYEVGNVYYFSGNSIEVQNVSVALSVGSGGVGQPLQARVYEFSLEDGLITSLLAETEQVTVTAEDLNGVGQSNMIYLPFEEPLTLSPNTGYAVMAYSPGGANDFIFALSGESPEWSSWAKFNEGQWGYLVNTPMVRLNLGDVVSVDQLPEAEVQAAPPYPNPATDEVHVPLTNPHAAVHWTWIDAQGRVVDFGTAPAYEHQGELTLAAPHPPGVYSLQIRPAGGPVVHHAMVVR